MDFKVENLCGFLIRGKLMTPDEMQTMRQRWLTEAKDANQVPAFLKWLVAKNYATEYQANLLAKGQVDDFFLGQYRIMERIGRGRMAGVYKAVHESGQVVAIKVLPPSRAKKEQMLARFQREARLAVKLKHPNVVRSFQVGEARGLHYLVMEYLEGETLDEVITRRKRMPPQEGVRLVHQALLGLQHLHEHNLVHRDLKPSNMMLIPAPARGDNETTLKSMVKILDIGLARELFDESSPLEPAERMDITGEGVLLGTPDYLAPEQARDPRTIDIRADIYSLGCTLYHLLTGQPPFPDKNILNQMIRHASETPKPLTAFNPSIPEGLCQIVGWMMAKQPDQRYPTPARAAQALDAFLLVTSDSGKPVEESPQMRKYLTWLDATEKREDADETLPPPEHIPPPPKLALSPAVKQVTPAKAMPVASPKTPPPPSKVATPEAKPPTPRTDEKAAETPPAPVAMPVSPAATTPTANQFDVELVEISATKPQGISKRDLIVFGLGGIVALVLIGCLRLAAFLVSWFRN